MVEHPQGHRLGEYQRARALDEDTLSRFRRVLGEDHPDTLTSAHAFALDLRPLSEYRQARAVVEDTLSRRRRVLDADDPAIKQLAETLVEVLEALGGDPDPE